MIPNVRHILRNDVRGILALSSSHGSLLELLVRAMAWESISQGPIVNESKR